jgi:hypothetical protein
VGAVFLSYPVSWIFDFINTKVQVLLCIQYTHKRKPFSVVTRNRYGMQRTGSMWHVACKQNH